MTKLDNYKCSEVQGSVIFKFNNEELIGYGIIDTNWTLKLNHKSTTLWYEKGEILMNHSLESVFLINKNEKILLKDLRNKNERLVNHYKKLFLELTSNFEKNITNFSQAKNIHEVYLNAKGV